MKGISLETGSVVVLSLDGSLVYVEAVGDGDPPAWVGVVALPDQLPAQSEYGQRVFTAGRVGQKKISPFSTADKKLTLGDLTERNQKFLLEFEELRTKHGPNYVDRTPEEQAAHDVAMAGPVVKSKKSRMSPEEKEAARAAKKTVFCAACDKPEEGHGTEHRFIAGKTARKPRAEKPVRETKMPRVPKRNALDVMQNFRWVGTDEAMGIMAAGNPKFQGNNSGGAIVGAIKTLGDAASPNAVAIALALTGRWMKVTPSRLALAFGQLLAAKLIETV